MVQANYLSTILLALLMLLILGQKTAGRITPGRLTISNASLALVAKSLKKNKSALLAPFDDASQFDPTEKYSASKLLPHLFLWELAERVPVTNVMVNLADPGFIKGTEIGREQSHGCFLMSRGIRPFAAVCYDLEGKEAARRLWQETLKELEFGGVGDTVDSQGALRWSL